MTAMKAVIFKKSKIRVDAEERVCLNDIHRAAGFSKNQTPADWTRLPSFSKEIASVLKRVTGKSHNWSKDEIKTVIYTRRTGSDKGTWANENIALGYAAYLSSDLAVEIRDVFLRYKKGDARLADEVLDRASPQDNEWAAVRALSRVKRNEFTEVLQLHGVKGFGYANCTDAVYSEVLGGSARKLKEVRGLPKKTNLRDKFDTDELISVMFAEKLSRQRIAEEKPYGNAPCVKATRRSSAIVRQAIEADKKDRQKPLV
ncbi:MAG: KilA-N domain-containing protein [Hoeflea sp.]|uniref:KilA-N domain-containing protein n=1 Tax=Hoeflea sp. TaxID=1940281 RepID=UPI0032F04090